MFPWVSQTLWFPQEQERQTGEAWVSAFFWFAAGIKEAAVTQWVPNDTGLPQVILRVAACTGRTLGFLSRMRASGIYLGIVGGLACSKVKRRRSGVGYRLTIDLRKDGDGSAVAVVIGQMLAAARV